MHNNFTGLPGLNLPSIDPLHIEKMEIVHGGSSAMSVDLKFNNIVLTGMSKSVAYKVSGFDKNAGRLTLKSKTPVFTLYGPYKQTGQVLILPIRGSGIANITMSKDNFYFMVKTENFILQRTLM